jgi:hypothetical protein
MPRTTTLRQATPARTAQIDDPHLCALLVYIGNFEYAEHYEDVLAEIQSAARSILASKPLSTAFAEFASRPGINDSVLDARQATLDARMKNQSITEGERREARKDAGLLRAIRANDDKVVPDAVSGDLWDLLVLTNMDAALIGAAVMYELLQGGRR